MKDTMVWDYSPVLICFVDPPFFSNALKKVCRHCGMIYICLDEHCVEKRFWKLYLFLLERELCFSCFISSLEA